jgi:hypothetical protein
MKFATASRRLIWIAEVLLAVAGSTYGQTYTIFPTTPPGPPVPLANGIAGLSYSASLSTNGAGPTSWSVTTGTLPPGLTSNPVAPNFLQFSGTPTTVGTYVFTVQASEISTPAPVVATQQYSITIIPQLVITTAPALPTAQVGRSYTDTLSATGGTPPYTWFFGQPPVSGAGRGVHRRAVLSPMQGPPPAGITLSSGGVLSGIPSAPGTTGFDITVSDSASSPQFATQTFTLTTNTRPTIVIGSVLPAGIVAVKYSTNLAAQGGNPPYSWLITGGFLPPGLTLSPAGLISGTPSQTGIYNFSAQVADSLGSTDSAEFNITVQGLAITTHSPLPNGAVGILYKLQFGAAGTPPYTWAVSGGSLPGGLTLDPVTGLLSGTPAAAGTSQFTVQLTDLNKAVVTGAFTLTIAPQLVITTTSLPNGVPGIPYLQKLSATGGTPPYAWSATGALPAGLTLDPASGSISGTPTTLASSSFVAQVTDTANVTASQRLTIAIGNLISFTTPSPLPSATGGSPYSQPIAVTGGTAPYTFTIDSGSAPAGITLDATGKLAGTPAKLGAFNFTVRATDANQSTATQAYALTVTAPTLPPPTIGGVTDTEPPGQQPGISLQLANAYPLPLDGTITLTFVSAVAADIDDPAIQFSTGGRTAHFTVPAGATTAVFPNSAFAVATGTLAGKITLTVTFQAGGQDVTPQPTPTRAITLPAQAPVITGVVASRNSGGLAVNVTGFSNTRDMTSASFQFQAASGTTLQTSLVTITVDSIFATWYNDPASPPFGSQFTFAQPFTISGNASGVTGVTVTLTNKQGASNAVTATAQ